MTYTIQIPESASLSEQKLKIILGGEFYERGLLSLGQAAEVAELSKVAFIEMMGKYGFSVFQQTSEDLVEDIKNA